MTKKELANELLTNMELTKEQYLSLCGLVDDLELDVVEKEPSWEEITSKL